MWSWLVASALAGECETVALREVVADATGIAAVAVRAIPGSVEVVGTDATQVKASGEACTTDAELRLVSKDGVVTVSAKSKAPGLKIRLEVPRSMTALTVWGAEGEVRASDLDTRLAVVQSSGPVAVQDVNSLRLQNITGPVAAADVRGDLLADHVTGPLEVDGVAGDLRVQGETAVVRHNAVSGRVYLP